MANMTIITGYASRTYRAFTAKIQYAILIYPAHLACLGCELNNTCKIHS